MGIDIDSFLEKHVDNNSKEKIEKKGQVDDKEEIDLSFNKTVAEKFEKLSKTLSDKDFDFLLRAYEEVKKFDGSLSTNLLSLKSISGKTLQDLGNRYSKEFLELITRNKESLKNTISNQLSLIDKALLANNFQEAIIQFNNANKNYKNFPKEFILEKTQIGKDLRNREIKINESFLKFKDTQINNIKKEIQLDLTKLRKSLTPDNLENIEENIHSLSYKLERLPKVFYSDLAKERIQISREIILAEDFLSYEYKKSFSNKKDRIEELTQKFHNYILKKEVNNALLTYDEIVLIFDKLPEVFIEDKIKIYNITNSLFNSLNNLLLSSNISSFMKTYEHSKIIEDTKEFLSHIKRTNKIEVKSLIELKQKLFLIPSRLKPLTQNLLDEIDELIEKSQKKEDVKLSSNNKSSKVNLFDKNLDYNSLNKDSVKENIMDEINNYYIRLKKSDNESEIFQLHKKITFYLNMLKIKDSSKVEILKKINSIINSKNINK